MTPDFFFLYYYQYKVDDKLLIENKICYKYYKQTPSDFIYKFLSASDRLIIVNYLDLDWLQQSLKIANAQICILKLYLLFLLSICAV